MRICGLFLVPVCLSLASLTLAQTSTKTAASADQNQVTAPPATVTGGGTTNYIPRWTGSSTLGNSKMSQTNLGIGIGNTDPQVELDVTGRINTSKTYRIGNADVLSLAGTAGAGNLAVGYGAFLSNTTGFSDLAIGYSALSSNSTGNANTATGFEAMINNTTGTGNTAAGYQSVFFNSTGNNNTGVGSQTLLGNTLGSGNTGIGYSALSTSNGGTDNTASGDLALAYNPGNGNTATGAYAMEGNSNNAVASNYNTADGYEALADITTGSYNIAVGYLAGLAVSIASNNIDIGSEGSGLDPNGTIRIGTAGTNTSFFAAGIRGVTTGDNNAIPVMIDSNGQLGTVSSSRRFKEDIQDMGNASEHLMQLRPVTFRYKKPFADGSQPKQYGLIAEEVAQIYPDLVAHSADGQIETIKYQLLDPMLLNEVQRQHAEIVELQKRLSQLESALSSNHGTLSAE